MPSPVTLAAEDPPFPAFFSDERIMNPRIRVGTSVQEIVRGECGAFIHAIAPCMLDYTRAPMWVLMEERQICFTACQLAMRSPHA